MEIRNKTKAKQLTYVCNRKEIGSKQIISQLNYHASNGHMKVGEYLECVNAYSRNVYKVDKVDERIVYLKETSKN